MKKTLEISLDNRAYPSPSPVGISGPYTGGDSKENKENFPAFTFYYDKEREFPEEGTMTIRYCVLKSDKDTRRPEDAQFSCTIAVEEIVSAEGEKDTSPTKKYNEAGDALDALRAEKMGHDDEGEGY